MATRSWHFANKHIETYFKALPEAQKTALHAHFEAAYLEGAKDAFVETSREIQTVYGITPEVIH